MGKSAPGLQDELVPTPAVQPRPPLPELSDTGEVVLEPAVVGSGPHLPQLGQEGSGILKDMILGVTGPLVSG